MGLLWPTVWELLCYSTSQYCMYRSTQVANVVCVSNSLIFNIKSFQKKGEIQHTLATYNNYKKFANFKIPVTLCCISKGQPNNMVKYLGLT